uniref:Uncharacterized protein n=1 Tax=Romanomermis culicivorax TaxID=13658 RepID=A0A915JQG5_ROMCU
MDKTATYKLNKLSSVLSYRHFKIHSKPFSSYENEEKALINSPIKSMRNVSDDGSSKIIKLRKKSNKTLRVSEDRNFTRINPSEQNLHRSKKQVSDNFVHLDETTSLKYSTTPNFDRSILKSLCSRIQENNKSCADFFTLFFKL